MNIGQQNKKCAAVYRTLVVLAGIIFFQSILYGPSLIGQKVLLPLDDLALPGCYLPQKTADSLIVDPQDRILFDQVDLYEPARRFSVSEIQHGRFPLWSPFQYAGVPVIWPKFSPFLLLEYTTSSPVILAWGQLVSALVAGTGMYVLGRRLLRASFWPSAIGAWLYPMTAFFVLWFGAWLRFPVCWLPWLFLMIDRAVRRCTFLSTAGLALVTGLTLISGNADVAGQVLLGGGLFALWCLWNEYYEASSGKKVAKAATLLALGWGLGVMLATPYLLPLVEYAHTGSRMVQRSLGTEERPPVGLDALPQIILPHLHGMYGKSLFKPADNLLEGSTAAFVGMIATMLMVPLAWLGKTRKRLNWFWFGLAFFGVNWCLDVPGFVQVLRLPGLNMMSHNRLVFLTAFAIFCLAVTGLDNVLQGRFKWRNHFLWPMGILMGFCVWGLYQSANPPQFAGISPLNELAVQEAFSDRFLASAAWCGVGIGVWLWLWKKKADPRIQAVVLAVLWSSDLVWFDYGKCSQADPKLYYPEIPALTEVAHAGPGRIIGAGCLPATLSVMAGLNDIRGYDSIDPARMVDLISQAVIPGEGAAYARIQVARPRLALSPPDVVHLSPILSMLGVRYVIARGDPLPGIRPMIQSDDCYILTNTNALSRVYVPRSVEEVTNDSEQLAKLGSAGFDPADVAYVPDIVSLPPVCRGNARITNETPTCIKIAVHMETAGLLVLADRWDKGWHATWNGSPVPMLQANYALRGVVLPAGSGTLEFYYRPKSLVLGCCLSGIAALMLMAMIFIHVSRRHSLNEA